MIIDCTTLIKLIFFEVEILSDIFLFVALIPTLFTVLAYKLQQIPQYVVFDRKQVNDYFLINNPTKKTPKIFSICE